MKTIFICVPWFSPAFKAGGPIQSISNMVNVLDEGYEFYIYTSNTDLDGLPIAVTNTNAWIQFNDHTKVWYATRPGRSANLLKEVALLKPDLLYMIGMYSWFFTMVPLFFAKAGDKLLSARGMLHPGALGEKAVKKKVFLGALKFAGIVKRCRFHATDLSEAGYIRQLFGAKANVLVADNFPRLLQKQPAPAKSQGSLTLVSVGLVSPMKNYKLVLEALKEVNGEVTYHIYGPIKDSDYWEQCLEVIRNLPANIRVIYHKEIHPSKVATILGGNHVFILPSKSENFGHAIFEALSAGIPVITSKQTPWNGLEESTAGLNVDPDVGTIQTAINHFLQMDSPEYNCCCEAAAGYARKHYNREGLIHAYGELFGGPAFFQKTTGYYDASFG